MASGTITPSSRVKVVAKSTTIANIAAGAAGSVSFSVAESGYTAVGLAGIDLSNNRCLIYRWFIANNAVTMQVQNTTSTAFSNVAVTFYVLYIAN